MKIIKGEVLVSKHDMYIFKKIQNMYESEDLEQQSLAISLFKEFIPKNYIVVQTEKYEYVKYYLLSIKYLGITKEYNPTKVYWLKDFKVGRRLSKY